MFSSVFELEETWVFQQTHQFTILKNGAYLVTTLLLQKLKITWQDKHSVMNLAHVCVKIWKKDNQNNYPKVLPRAIFRCKRNRQ